MGDATAHHVLFIGTTSSAGFAGTALQLRRPVRPRRLPLDQPWQAFVDDLSVHCELAALDF